MKKLSKERGFFLQYQVVRPLSMVTIAIMTALTYPE